MILEHTPLHPGCERRLRNKLLVLLVSLLTLSVASSGTAHAADLFPAGSTGYDISFPQCSGPLPAKPYAFGIVGATGGRAFTTNPCFATQYAWAAQGAAPPGVYVNLKSPIGSNADEALTGPAGTCVPTNQTCLGYNFGYKTAQHAVTFVRAQNVTPSSWWLDIETMSSWSTDTKMNAVVIGAATDYLRTQGMTVGIYSNPGQWIEIAGTYSPGLPMWIAMAPNAATAPVWCSKPFAGGEIHLVQYIVGGFDNNYVCRAQDRIPPPPVPATPVGPVGSAATIAADGDCLNVRAQAGLTATSNGCLASGTRVTLLEGALIADGMAWQRVSAGAVSGWAAAQFLRAGEPTPTSTPVPTPTPTPTPTGTFAGTPVFSATGQALAVFHGGTVDQLESASMAIGATGIWAQESNGTYQLLIVRGPVFANAPFRSAFPTGFLGATGLTLRR